MTPRTQARPTTRRERTVQHIVVSAHVHPAKRIVWLDVVGQLSPALSLRSLLVQLRRAHERIPTGIDVVGLDLTGLDEITIELAVVLCLESRMLGVRGIDLAVAVRDGTRTAEGAVQVLERLRMWRVDDAELAELAHVTAHARRGEDGWRPLAR